MLGTGPVRFGGGPNGKGPAQAGTSPLGRAYPDGRPPSGWRVPRSLAGLRAGRMPEPTRSRRPRGSPYDGGSFYAQSRSTWPTTETTSQGFDEIVASRRSQVVG
jgi:hypothetical protein